MREKLTRRRLVAMAAASLGLADAGDRIGGSERGLSVEGSVDSARWLQVHESDDSAATSADALSEQTEGGSAAARTPEAEATDAPTATDSPDPPFRRTERTLMAGTRYETTVHEIEADADGPTTLVVGGMHGDERSGVRAARRVAGWRVERGRLVVLPVANAPAVERDSRRGPHGDLNRQFPPTADREPTSPPARAIWELVREVDPDRLLDLHASVGVYEPGDGEDGGVGQAIFPADVSPAPAEAQRAVRAVNREFGLAGPLAYRRGNLLDGDRPMLAHRARTVLETPAFILETYRRPPLARQVDWHAFAVDTLLRAAGQPPA